MASIVSSLAFVVTIVALACDFVMFGIVKRKVNGADSDSSAHWGVAIWLVVVAAICTLLGTIVIFLSCCAGRRSRNREARKVTTYHE